MLLFEMHDIGKFVAELTRWSGTRNDVEALAIVGSYANGTAKRGSDVDVVIITDQPERYIENGDWTSHFGSVNKSRREDWGRVQVLRVFYDDGREVEFGMATREWARADPVDDGTRAVVNDGLKILFDRDGLLKQLAQAVRN